MKPRTFNSVMHPVNEAWAAEVLNMQRNLENGPDLIDNDKVVEVKFCLVYSNKYKHMSWRTLEYQLEYNAETPAFWSFGIYQFDRPVSSVQTKDPAKLEAMVSERELWLVEWDWVNQFPCYTQKGKTAKSEWYNEIRFPKFKALPKTTHAYKVSKGFVYVTEGVPSEAFDIKAFSAVSPISSIGREESRRLAG